MKDKILKIAGVKSEAAFYKKFPTEAAFKKAHGKELKKAQLGASMVPEIGSYMGGEKYSTPNINYAQVADDVDYFLTGKNQAKRTQQTTSNAQQSSSRTANDLNAIAGIIGKMKKGGEIEKYQWSGPGLWGTGSNTVSGQPSNSGVPVNPNAPLMFDISGQTGYKEGAKPITGMKNKKKGAFGIDEAIPVIGGVIQGIGMVVDAGEQQDYVEQQAALSNVALKASGTRGEQSKRIYNNPWDARNLIQPGQFNKPKGVGGSPIAADGMMVGGNPTEIQNTYAPNNTLYDDLGYEPLEDSNQVKQYRRGGLVRAQGGYTQIGSSIGGAFGPLGSIVGGGLGIFADQIAGARTRGYQDTVNRNATQIGGQVFGQQFNAANSNVMEDGGWMNPEYNPQVIAKFGDHTAEDYYNAGHEGMESLRAGGHLTNYTPPSEEAMETMALGGQLKTHWGGYAEPISKNPYDVSETVMFKGDSKNTGSHSQRSSNGETGIGVEYGDNNQDSYTDYAEYGTKAAISKASVEVQKNEPGKEMIDPKTGKKMLHIGGGIKTSKAAAMFAGDKSLAGKTYQKNIANIALDDAKLNKAKEKNLIDIANHKVETSYDKLKQAGLEMMGKGYDMQQQKNHYTSEDLLTYQSALNEFSDEMSEATGKKVDPNYLDKGKIKYEKSNMKSAKFGKSIKKAQEGVEQDQPSHFREFDPYDPIGMQALIQRAQGKLAPYDARVPYDPSNLTSPKDLRDVMVRSVIKKNKEQPIEQVPPENNVVRIDEPKKKRDWIDTAMMAYNEALPFIRPTYKIGQPDLSAEMMAATMNQTEGVPLQLANLQKSTPYTISLDSRRNEVRASFNAARRAAGSNPAALAAISAQESAELNKIGDEEFRINQQQEAGTYASNRDIMNKQQLMNMEAMAKQAELIAITRSNTKKQAMEIAKSISDKLAQAKKEQMMANIEQQRYNYRFDEKGRLINMNPLARFNMYGTGKNQQAAPPEGYEYRYNSKQEPVDIVKSKSTAKNGSKIKARNGSIVKAIKNL